MLRRRIGWIMVVLSLALHLVTVYCFTRQPDRLAAFTVMPIWLWGGIGLALSSGAFVFLKASLSLVLTGVWAVTLLVGADEARVLAHFGKSPPQPGPAAYHKGTPLIRVVTMNCAVFDMGSPAKDIALWQPDVVLLQDTHPHQVRRIADELFGGHGDYRSHLTIGVVTKWKIQREVRNPAQRSQQVTIQTPDGRSFEVLNLHLVTAATDLRLWRRESWREHRINRAVRQNELLAALTTLEQTTNFPETPTLLGGDFNAPATDIVHRFLTRDFTDAFAASGTGWANTYHRRFPILRIDHLYSSAAFTPIRCGTSVSRHSDHRMVIADYLFR
jgi:endonuclease/exonuclease/phosphatase (EEP) superfamily protein YafD